MVLVMSTHNVFHGVIRKIFCRYPLLSGAMILISVSMYTFFSSPEQKLRVSYCYHPMSIFRRPTSTISLLTL